MSKLKEFAKKFGISRKNGVPEQLKQAQMRVEGAETKAREALERMKSFRLNDRSIENQSPGELLPLRR